MRTLVIGDIHGCLNALESLLAIVNVKPTDQIVTLGDYVDRGPNSKGVLDKLIQIHLTQQLIPLRGNHELMMLSADKGNDSLHFWLSCGGVEALESYVEPGKTPSLEDIPQNHWHFLKHKLHDWYETDTHIFVHANLHPGLPLNEQTSDFLHWEFLNPKWHKPHFSNKIMICGHSEQRNGVPLNLGSAIGIDTRAYGGGWLTCLDVDSGEYWQANEQGDTRLGHLSSL
jgi:serine/threonine protein phosphatase 1